MKVSSEQIYKDYKHGMSCFDIMLEHRIGYKAVCNALLRIGGKDFKLPNPPVGQMNKLDIWASLESMSLNRAKDQKRREKQK